MKIKAKIQKRKMVHVIVNEKVILNRRKRIMKGSSEPFD